MNTRPDQDFDLIPEDVGKDRCYHSDVDEILIYFTRDVTVCFLRSQIKRDALIMIFVVYQLHELLFEVGLKQVLACHYQRFYILHHEPIDRFC